MLDSRPLNVLETLAPVRRGLGVARLERSTLQGLTRGAATGVVVLSLVHLWAWITPAGWTPVLVRSSALPLALGLVLAGAVAGLVYGVLRWPNPVEAARVADRHFGLKDRLTTALEFAGSQEPVPILQRNEAAGQLKGLRLVESVQRGMAWLEWGLPASAVAVLAALLLLSFPPPQGTAGATNTDQARIQQAAKATLPGLLRRVETRLTPQSQEDPALRRLDQALANLQRQLLHTSDRATALRAISATQQQIQRSAAALHPINSGAVASLSHALGAYMNRSQRSDSAAGKAAGVTAQALDRLAAGLTRLSATQRAQLARSLSQAAASSTDRGLQSSLRTAAASLAQQDAQAAASALQQASTALSSASRTQSAEDKLNAASSQLDLLKNSIAGMAGSQTGGATRNAGRSSTAGNANGATAVRPASASAPASILQSHLQGSAALKHGGLGGPQENALPPNTRNLNRNLTRGALASSSEDNLGSDVGPRYSGGLNGQSGRGGLGGNGTGGQGGSYLKGPGQFVTVFVPGTVGGSGPQTVSTTSENGGLFAGHIVPYQIVVARYARSAHAALNRTALPPSLESYVRRYFSAVSR